jgi:hypothetical protein
MNMSDTDKVPVVVEVDGAVIGRLGRNRGYRATVSRAERQELGTLVSDCEKLKVRALVPDRLIGGRVLAVGEEMETEPSDQNIALDNYAVSFFDVLNPVEARVKLPERRAARATPAGLVKLRALRDLQLAAMAPLGRPRWIVEGEVYEVPRPIGMQHVWDGLGREVGWRCPARRHVIVAATRDGAQVGRRGDCRASQPVVCSREEADAAFGAGVASPVDPERTITVRVKARATGVELAGRALAEGVETEVSAAAGELQGLLDAGAIEAEEVPFLPGMPPAAKKGR